MPIKTFEQQLEEARAAEEKFTAPDVPVDEEPTKDETTPEEITAEMWANVQATVGEMTGRALKAEGLVRRYVALYGPLED